MFELITRGFELVTWGFELVTCAFESVTRGFEPVTGISEFVTGVLLFHLPEDSPNNFNRSNVDRYMGEPSNINTYCNITDNLPYQVPNKLLSSEKFAHHVLVLFYWFRDEK